MGEQINPDSVPESFADRADVDKLNEIRAQAEKERLAKEAAIQEERKSIEAASPQVPSADSETPDAETQAAA